MVQRPLWVETGDCASAMVLLCVRLTERALCLNESASDARICLS